MLSFYNIIGFFGDFIALSSYGLLQFKIIKSTSIIYSLLNLVGVLMLLFSLFFAWNLPVAIIQISWVFISVYGLFRAIKEKAAECRAS